MRLFIALVTVAACGLQGQVIPGPRWYRSAYGMYGQSPLNASALELGRLEQYLIFSQSSCTGLTPQQYATNQAVARNMLPYLAAVSANATDLQARSLAGRLSLAF